MNDPSLQIAINAVLQRARELSLESSSQEKLLGAFAATNACGRCGRLGLDREGYTDCKLVRHNGSPGELVCDDCLAR